MVGMPSEGHLLVFYHGGRVKKLGYGSSAAPIIPTWLHRVRSVRMHTSPTECAAFHISPAHGTVTELGRLMFVYFGSGGHRPLGQGVFEEGFIALPSCRDPP